MCYLLFKVILLCVCFVVICGQKLNEKCKLHDHTPGYCTYINDCSLNITHLSNTILHDLCESSNFKDVICCPFHNIQRLKINRKCTEKCLEYLNFNANRRYARNIAGGFRALPGEFAHMAALGYEPQKNKFFWDCGGTLISEKYVLTAAHCLKTKKYGPVKYVRLGDLDLNSDEDMVVRPQTFTVKKIIKHPKFHRKNKLNDIGLMELNQTARFGLHVFPACLYANKKIVYDSLTAIGWSSMNFKRNDESKSLMKANLDVFSTDMCRWFYHSKYNLTILKHRQFCAVGTQSIMDTCQGSSGSPLLAPTYYNKKMHYVVGIVSFGPKCGEINNPGIYTKIAYYISWIEKIVWP